MTQLTDILQRQKNVKVIAPDISYSDYVTFDLSDKATDLIHLPLTDAFLFEDFVEQHLATNGAKVAYGGYLEKRNLYKRSTVFKNTNSNERNIHIGLDLWIKAETQILAALDGIIHSFQNNTAVGDYGPTIILEHTVENCTFYTLYGHLSLDSLDGKSEGQRVCKGEIIGKLGSSPINGDYAPHLHFQIIEDLEEKKGDYPGVCSKNDLVFYSNNCPDPELLLQIKSSDI